MELGLGVESSFDCNTRDSTVLDEICGEIYFKKTKKSKEFYIICTFCIIQFNQFEEFTTHCKHKHFGNPIDQNDFENSFDFAKTDSDLDEQINRIDLDLRCEQNDIYVDIDNSDFNFNIESNKYYDSSQNKLDNIKILNERDTFVEEKTATKQILSYISKSMKKSTGEIKQSNAFSSLENSKMALKIRQKKKKSNHFPCDLCQKSFTTKSQLENHEKNEHDIEGNSVSNSKSVSDNEKIITQSTPGQSADIINHINSNIGGDFSSDNESENDNKNTAELGTQTTKCRFCNLEFKYKFKRIQHERVHTGEKPYKCRICDRKFSSERYCKDHEFLHSGKKFECDICGATFSGKCARSTHIRRHKIEKLHSCSYCERKYHSKVDKKIHERTHTGEKPYQCITCGLCFSTTSNLHAHTRRNHRNGVEIQRPYTCEVCGRSFVMNYHLKRHFAVHSNLRPFSCEICEKSYKWRKGLNQHQKLHTDKKSHTSNT